MAVWTRTGNDIDRGADARPATTNTGSGNAVSALIKRAGYLAVEPKRAALHLAVAVMVAALNGVPGGDASPVLFVWLAVALADLAFASGWKRMLSGHGEDADYTPPPATGIVMTGSISSTVKLDYDAGTAEKSYQPTKVVRLLYRLSFHAPFPYKSNVPAVEAARHRRTVIGLLTQYWYGENLVAPALDVRVAEDGQITFVSELVRGTAPKDLPRAKALLAGLTERFLESGLPSWQVGSYNPRSIGNLIEREDGSFRIIDLESNLVTPILPPRAAVRAIRAGLYPSFDEIDTDRLDAYLAEHRESIVAAIGEAGAAELFAAAANYEAAQGEWHAAEPRIASKALKFAFRLVDVPTWVRGIRRLTLGSEQLAENFTSAGIAAWQEEGRLTPAEAERLRASLTLPEVASASANLGAHMAMSVPLRFPLGSIARSLWTVGMRIKGEWMALRGRGSAHSSRQVHSLPVAIVAAVPGLGTFAYTVAKPLRQQRAIGAIALDQSFRHLSMRAYRGLHLDSLTLWMAQSPVPAIRRPLAIRVATQLHERMHAISRTAWVTAAVLLANAAIVAAAIALDGTHARFSTAPVDVIRIGLLAQLFIAGGAGILAFRAYWRRNAGRPELDEASGMFLWGAGAIVLIGLGVDYGLGVHEAVFGFTAAHANVFPMITDPSKHLITLGYVAIAGPLVLGLRHELSATRASATWLAIALVAGSVLIGTESVGQLANLQTAAGGVTGGALTLAFASRLAETQLSRQTAEGFETEPLLRAA